MAREHRQTVKTNLYHILFRGNNRRLLFKAAEIVYLLPDAQSSAFAAVNGAIVKQNKAQYGTIFQTADSVK
jgi:hypothetical protein